MVMQGTDFILNLVSLDHYRFSGSQEHVCGNT